VPDSTQPGTRGRQHHAFRLFLSTALVATLAVAAEQHVVEGFRVVSGSMEPTLQVGDWLLGYSLTFARGPVRRGDLVTFYPPRGRPSPIPLVKRVVGLPGETVAVRRGVLEVDGAPLAEPYLHGAPIPYWMARVEVPRDSVYVLGDNRARSEDSTVFGPVEVRRLRDRVWVRLGPWDRRCAFTRPSLGLARCG
jgi:signal peptidase I